MIPEESILGTLLTSAPRSRGDDPEDNAPALFQRTVLPAHAGMILREPIAETVSHRAPRSRGDDPAGDVAKFIRESCSPLTRG